MDRHAHIEMADWHPYVLLTETGQSLGRGTVRERRRTLRIVASSATCYIDVDIEGRPTRGMQMPARGDAAKEGRPVK